MSRGWGRIGLGGGALGSVDDDDAFFLLDAAVERGVRFIDVARSYGDAEARLGRWLRARPGVDVVVCTKGGYGVGVVDWTGAAVARAIDEARRRSGRERLDVFLLHSCGRAALERDDVGDALRQALEDGKVSDVGYSGDNDDLHVALDHAADRRFTVIEQSLSLLDGAARIHTLPRARAGGLSVIAKRALANAPWIEDDGGPDRTRQRQRWQRACVPDVGVAPAELFLRFAAFTPGVDTTLVGTRRVAGLQAALDAVERGPLSDDVMLALAPALGRCDDDALV